MDAAMDDGQYSFSAVSRLQRTRAGALDRAKLRDPEYPQSSQDQAEVLEQWGSDGLRRRSTDA